MDRTPPPPPARLTAKVVGDEFAKQYYHVSQNQPDKLPRFYTNASKIGRLIGNDGVMRVSSLSDIEDHLNVLSFGGFESAVVTSITSQDSRDGSVMVSVGGYFTLKARRNFTQGFFLAPQQDEPKAYTVLHDILRVDDQLLPANNDDDSQRVSNPNDGIEDVSEISDASVVGDPFADRYFHVLEYMPYLLDKAYQDNSLITRPVEDGSMRVFTLSDVDENLNMLLSGGYDSAEVTSVTSQYSRCGGVLVVVSGYFISNMRRERYFIQTFFLARQDAPSGYFVFTDIFNFVDNLSGGALIESSTVHVRSLPPNARNNIAIRDAFKEFGPIKHNGIRIKNPGWSHYHAFVEFKEANAAKRAIEASPVWIAGQRVTVEKARGPDYWERKRIRKEEEEEEASMLQVLGGRSEQLGGARDYNFWEWLEQTQIQSWLQGDRHYRDYSQAKVMEEHSKFMAELQRKLVAEEEENQNRT